MPLRVPAAACLAFLLALPAQAQKPDDAPPESGLVSVPGFPATGIPGQAAGDQFGRAVASAGDVNGDGYDDLVVGARTNDAGGTDAGRATIYFGGPGGQAPAPLVLTGAAGDQFGTSVAGAGDVNGDGYDDVVVGAPFNDAGGVDAGRATVYFGGPAMNATPDLVLTGAAAGDQFGNAVAGAGDINGDGFADVLVGAFLNDAGGSAAGRAYAFFGGTTPNATPDLVLTGAAAFDQFGSAVAGAGDVNGDGFADVIVGAWGNDAGGSSAGRAYVYFGGPAADATADLTLTGAATSDNFGFAVAGAGDVNGDGFDDVIVGARTNDAGSSNGGSAAVFFGGTAPDALPDLTLTGTVANGQLGRAVAGAGDVNGDGFADVIVGAPYDGPGRAFVYFGGTTPDALPDLSLSGVAASDEFGFAVAGSGDLDGDGLPDLAVGAPSRDTANGTDSGAVTLYSNANTGAGIAFWGAIVPGGELFGGAVASAGDVNGDGYDDIIVGASSNSVGGPGTGRAYVFFGGPDADTIPDLTLTGEAAFDRFGGSVAGTGDINGDGYDDIIVGSGDNDAGGADAGRVYVYFGGPAPDTVADLVLTGTVAGERLGFSVAFAGDLNGDGFDDVVVGAPNNDSAAENAGRFYVYLGGVTPDATADLTVPGAAASDNYGLSVAGAGDVNGDGYDDFLVGAPGNDTGGDRAGRTYLYFGGATLEGTSDVRFTGQTAIQELGTSIGGAGDINGDGYADVIVGNRSTFNTAYVYYGGPQMDSTPDLVLAGEAGDDQFGRVVSSAGDVNGDGYDDIIVGARYNDAGGLSAGRAYVYFGAAAPDATPDLVFTGAGIGDTLGEAVASAGDVNGDGRADVIVSATYFGMGPDEFDEVYLYSATGPSASPSLFRLADIPGDQGGMVQARWMRSGQEMRGLVTGYRVERSMPAGSAGYAWEVAADVPTGNTRYSLAVPTYSNQTGTNPGTTCVRVTALGADGERWRSTVRCGASIDNLAPDAPPSLAVAESPTGDARVSVAPLATPPADLAGYAVYRSADNTCDAADAFVGLATDLLAPALDDDATPFGTDVWYCATARDVHGNESAFVGAASANPAVLAAVKVVLQGAYQAGLPGGALMRTDLEDFLPLAQPYAAAPWSYAGAEAIPATDTDPANGRPDLLDAHAVVDWVLVEIRTSPTDAAPTRAAALLLADGTLLDPATASASARVRPAAAGAYHVAVTHRTHLAAMSAFLVSLTTDATAAYDLTASPLLVYGSNAVAPLGGGVYGLYAGDGDGSGSVLAGDRQTVWLPQVGQTGYLPGDFNLSGTVLADDRQTLWVPNVGRQSAVPGASLREEVRPDADR